ncbi:MAG: hypothetical protein Q8N14_05390 [Candidatus Omnitrophota bacterium]|nr:hypothetical protein [Candidatus Omnitrophota bacterium]
MKPNMNIGNTRLSLSGIFFNEQILDIRDAKDSPNLFNSVCELTQHLFLRISRENKCWVFYL